MSASVELKPSCDEAAPTSPTPSPDTPTNTPTPPVTMVAAAPSSIPATSVSAPALLLTTAATRQVIYDQYAPWVQATYGDSAKTKTITSKKYTRIVALLKVSEKESGGTAVSESTGATSEAAKFRLWVKSKGFHLGPPLGHPEFGKRDKEDDLYLPTGTDKSVDGKVHFVYKKVARVEQFFDIIYSVHVEASGETQLRGRAGKHCGQKRTYRAVADHYAFIPREAISKFLLYCVECQRKNSMDHRNGRSGGNSMRGSGAASSAGGADSPIDTHTSDSTDTTEHSEYQAHSPASSQSPFGGGSGSACGNGKSAHSVLNLSPPATPSSVSSVASSSTPLTPTAAAALTQAMAAMHHSLSHPLPIHPLQMRNSLLAASAHAILSSAGGSASAMASGLTSASGAQSLFGQSALFNAQSAALLSAAKFGASGDIDLTLPITSTYLKRMRALGLATGLDPTYPRSFVQHLISFRRAMSSKRKDSHPSRNSSAAAKQASSSDKMDVDESGDGKTAADDGPVNWMANGSQLSALLTQGHLNSANNGHNGHNNNGGDASPSASDEQGCGDDASSTGAKDDDDDDDDDDVHAGGDPEKLKAFNMFVRLFVDENLDRHVPISKQPREKIQAIIDSCTRQFPEYASRARKRIRTYLKSCRRTKRSREQAGLDAPNSRPTPPHLTSVQAEHLLARACENESENAKRMRMGLEPISQPMPVFSAASAAPIDVLSIVSSVTSSTNSGLSSSPMVFSAAPQQLKTEYKSDQLVSLLAASQPDQSAAAAAAAAAVAANAFPTLNGGSLFRPNFTTASPMTFPGTTALLQQAQSLQNGPSLLDGLKKPPLLSHKLSVNEMGAVRQLITGYRESAAFLLRSADELEHLLQIQPKL